jgi:hypothetical protein
MGHVVLVSLFVLLVNSRAGNQMCEAESCGWNINGRTGFPCLESHWMNMRRRIVCSLIFMFRRPQSITPRLLLSLLFSGSMEEVMVVHIHLCCLHE